MAKEKEEVKKKNFDEEAMKKLKSEKDKALDDKKIIRKAYGEA